MDTERNNQLAKVTAKRDSKSDAVINELEDTPMMFNANSQPSPIVRRFSNFNSAEEVRQCLKLQVETTDDFWRAFHEENPDGRDKFDEKDADSLS